MFTLGFAMAQVFVPTQAAAFATITPSATGRASTMFNAVRQLGGAIGVALLTTVIVLIGATHVVAGHEVANLTAYRVTFLVAAAICLAGVASALSIRDADAAATIPSRRGGERSPPRRPPPMPRRRRPRATPWPEPAGGPGIFAAPSSCRYPGRTAAITWRGAGLALGRPSITMVGTVSVPAGHGANESGGIGIPPDVDLTDGKMMPPQDKTQPPAEHTARPPVKGDPGRG